MTVPTTDLDTTDRKLLDFMQRAVPLVRRPWRALAEQLGLDEAQVLDRVGQLRRSKGIIRQISAIFDTKALGYESSLVAARVQPHRVDQAAAIIAQHPGVSHNYLREHELNLWYTLAVPPDSTLGLHRTIQRLHRLSGALATRALPTLKLYKIGVRFQLTDDPAQDDSTDGRFTDADRQQAQAHRITEQDKPLIRALQQDLPVDPQPFDQWADQAGCSVEELLAGAERYRQRRQMRRFAAVLHHRSAGMRSNVMGVWSAPQAQADMIGQKLAEFPAVSHCYLRPRYDDWPYNLYTMVHARDRDQALATLDAMARETGLTERAALWSVKEYKKTRVRYFTGEILRWERDKG